MGMFFLLVGYFTPESLARKGVRQLLQERRLRLGVPLLVFGFVLGPLAVALAAVPAGRPLGEHWLGQLSQGRFVIGPLWFAWALLLLAAGFVAWRHPPEPASDPGRAVPASITRLAAALAIGAAALVVRQAWPASR